ncbi:MAG: TetR/AcrR family transcriptional regulator [Alphaproteobacteria bacterium]|nr:TetR/AcrR family transcriptional regulator [Alphaproteobacteria bacterium]
MAGRGVATPIKNERLVSERRARIVAAAQQVFRAKGFHETTVRDVGEAAGLTQGTLYNYVRSKADILYLVVSELTGAYMRDVRAAVEGISDPQRRLAVAVRALIETMDRRQEEILLLYHESHALDRDSLRHILSMVAEFIGLFQTILKEARAAGLALAPPAREDAVVADFVTFLPTILALRRWHLRRAASHARVIRELTAFILRGLGVVEPDALARAAEGRVRRTVRRHARPSTLAAPQRAPRRAAADAAAQRETA